MTVQLVELVSSPLDELRPLVVAYGREVPQDPAAAHPDNVLQEFTRLMGSPYVLVLAARDGERTVGYAVAQLMHDPSDDAICVLIRHAYLAPGYRRRGIVWQGLQAIHAWASRHHAGYFAVVTRRGKAMARLLHWRHAGHYHGADVLVTEVSHGH